MGRIVKNEIPPETLDRILDAFVVKSDVAHVSITTGINEQVVREALSSPETALLAMRRKAAQKSVWLYGAVFDILDDMVRNGDSREQIQGTKLYREFLKDIPSAPAVLPESPEPKQIVGEVLDLEVHEDAEVEELPEGVRIEDLILNG